MKNTLLLILFSTLCLSAYSQLERGDIELSFNPTPLLFCEPRLSFCLEKKTSSNTGFSFTLGLGNQKTALLYKNTNGSSDSDINQLFFEARPEFKYYPAIFTIPIYISCEAFYLQFRKTKFNDSFGTINSNAIYYYEKADFIKEKYGITIIGGLKSYILNGKYFAEFFGGLGIANRIVDYKNITFTDKRVNSWSIFGSNYDEQGSKIVPNIVIGMRLGFIAK